MWARTREIEAAVVREEFGPFEIEMLDLEGPRAGEVLVRIVGAGVCHTDIAVRDQYYPTPLPAVLGLDARSSASVVAGRHWPIGRWSCSSFS